MAVSAAIESNRGVNESSKRRSVVANVSYSAENHSNGYALDKALFGYQVEIESILFLEQDSGSSRQYKWDEANQTIRIYEESAGTYAEVTSALTEAIRVQAQGY